MSVEAIAIALHHSRATGTTKVVLLGIANHDGDGGAWPAVSTLMKYANSDRRTVQRAIEKLEKLHEIKRHIQAGGDHRIAEWQRPNRYQFLLACPADCDRSSRHASRSHKTVELEFDPAASMSPRGTDAAPPAAPVPPKPSLNPNTAKIKKVSNVSTGKRIPATASCGHVLIDERHCERGCKPEVTA